MAVLSNSYGRDVIMLAGQKRSTRRDMRVHMDTILTEPRAYLRDCGVTEDDILKWHEDRSKSWRRKVGQREKWSGRNRVFANSPHPPNRFYREESSSDDRWTADAYFWEDGLDSGAGDRLMALASGEARMGDYIAAATRMEDAAMHRVVHQARHEMVDRLREKIESGEDHAWGGERFRQSVEWDELAAQMFSQQVAWHEGERQKTPTLTGG